MLIRFRMRRIGVRPAPTYKILLDILRLLVYYYITSSYLRILKCILSFIFTLANLMLLRPYLVSLSNQILRLIHSIILLAINQVVVEAFNSPRSLRVKVSSFSTFSSFNLGNRRQHVRFHCDLSCYLIKANINRHPIRATRIVYSKTIVILYYSHLSKLLYLLIARQNLKQAKGTVLRATLIGIIFYSKGTAILKDRYKADI